MSSKEGCCKFIEKLNGELYGFIHSAGVLQDSMLMNLTWEKFETVFQCLVRAVRFVMGVDAVNMDWPYLFSW